MGPALKSGLKLAGLELVIFVGAVGVVLVVVWARGPAGKSAELHLQTGHSFSVQSVAFSPDGQTLASGSHDNTVKLWDWATGETNLVLTTTPANQWIAFQPDRLFYSSSRQGDEWVAIRFDSGLRDLYPLEYYREELLTGNLTQALDGPDPVVRPQPVRRF